MTLLYQKLKKDNEYKYIQNFLCDLVHSKSSDFDDKEIEEIITLRNKLPHEYHEKILDILSKTRINDSSLFWFDLLKLENNNLSIVISRVMSQLKDKEEFPSNQKAYPLLEKLLSFSHWQTEEIFEQKFLLLNELPKKAFVNAFKLFASSPYFKNLNEEKQIELMNKTMYHHRDIFYHSLLNKSNIHLFFKKILPENVYEKTFTSSNIIGFSFAQIIKITMQKSQDENNKQNHYIFNYSYIEEKIIHFMKDKNMTENEFKKSIFTAQPLLNEIILSSTNNLNAKQALYSFLDHYNKVAKMMNYEIFDLSKKETFEKILFETQLSINSTSKTKFKL